MREILFRGKQKDNGEWVEGYYNYATDGYNLELHLISDKITGIHTEVIPETVGQYTGLTDKNGKKIFEGDIISCKSRLDSANMVVIFECGQFRMVLAEKYHNYVSGGGYYDINCFEKSVIGNIHGNPKLLEGCEK